MNRNEEPLEDGARGAGLSRREALGIGLAGIWALWGLRADARLAPVHGGLRSGQRPGPYAPFRMGIQSYSLRSFGLDDALAKTQQLGLNYWESFSSHIPLTNDPAELAEIKSKLAARNVTLRAWGVHAFDGDEAAARRVFEFADALGLEAISADPTPEALPILDKLVNDFKIHIAIHNHGPGSRYDKLESVLRALKDRSPGMGVCVDTGHTLRSGEDPVEWVKTLGPRVHGMHLKDVLDRSKWVVFGKGDLDAVALFKELLRIPFHGVMSLEYEENPRDPIPEIEACLAAVRDAIAKAKSDR